MQTESTDVSRTRPETKQKKQPRGRASAMQRFCFRVQQYALGSCSDRRSLASSSMTTRRAALTVTFVSDITAMLSHDFGASETRARPKKKIERGTKQKREKKTLVRAPAERALHVQLSQPPCVSQLTFHRTAGTASLSSRRFSEFRVTTSSLPLFTSTGKHAVY